MHDIQSKDEQERILREASPSYWEAIDQSIIESLVKSMPVRIKACIRANSEDSWPGTIRSHFLSSL
jgi:hypothetical protein